MVAGEWEVNGAAASLVATAVLVRMTRQTWKEKLQKDLSRFSFEPSRAGWAKSLDDWGEYVC